MSTAGGGGQGGSSSSYDHLFKLLLIGDSGVGKSSILLRFTDDAFNDRQLSTIGVDFKVKYLAVEQRRLKLAIWDTAGQERFRTLTSSYYRGAQGVILVYDCSSRASFEHLQSWLDEVRKYSTNQEAIKLLVANKTDKASAEGQSGGGGGGGVVTREEGEQFAASHSMLFIETSAKTRKGIQQAFEEIVYKILETPSLLANTQPAGQRLEAQQSDPSQSGRCC